MPNKLCYNKNASTTEKSRFNFAPGGTQLPERSQ